MPHSVLFDGTDDERTYSKGGLNGGGALSVAAIVKVVNFDGFYPIVHNPNGTSPLRVKPGSVVNMYDGSIESDSTTTLQTNEWYLIGVSRPAGSAQTTRAHIYRYSTDTWTHENMSGSSSNITLTSVRIANGFDSPFPGNILIVGIWDGVLSDGEFEALKGGLSDWDAETSFTREIWRFDHAGVIAPNPTGTGWQTATVGGTLDTDDAPTGWLDSYQVRHAGAGAGSGWTSPGNIVNSDDSRASILVAGPVAALVGSSYGFTIPSGAPILGVTAYPEISLSATGSDAFLASITLRDTGSIGNNLTDAVTFNAVDTIYTYGGAANLWGATLTDSIVNGSGFGVGTAYDRDIVNGTVRVDMQLLRVHFNAGSGYPVVNPLPKRQHPKRRRLGARFG